MVLYVMHHAAEGCDAGAGADEKKVLVKYLWKHKNTKCTAERDLGADGHMIEHVRCAFAGWIEYDEQFKNVGTIGPTGDGIAAPAFVRFFVDGKVQGYKLSGLELKVIRV